MPSHQQFPKNQASGPTIAASSFSSRPFTNEWESSEVTEMDGSRSSVQKGASCSPNSNPNSDWKLEGINIFPSPADQAVQPKLQEGEREDVGDSFLNDSSDQLFSGQSGASNREDAHPSSGKPQRNASAELSGLGFELGDISIYPQADNVSRSLVQRDEPETGSPEPESTDSEVVDAELEAILAEVLGVTPVVPAFEAITSTTAGEYSRGELESEIQRLWRRERMSFTDAARRAAREDTIGSRGPRATQSAETQPDTPYGQRWVMNLFAADYQTWSDLPEIMALLRRGSPFQRAIAEESFDQTIAVTNPTASVIETRLYDTIHNLWLSLDEGQIGELVVSFSGHGGNGTINGVDGGDVTAADLTRIANFAGDFNIHVVYILDTCRAGLLANYAQAEAIADIDEQSRELPEEGQVSIRESIQEVRTLGRFASLLSGYTIHVGDAARTFRRRNTSANFQNLFQALIRLSDKAIEFGDHLRQTTPFMTSLPNLSTLRREVGELMMSTVGALDGNRSAVNSALRDSAELLDDLNTTLNTLITQIQAQMASSRSESEASP